ncbi:MAG: DUF1848 domain-containing protein [Treponema sp.]|jgi:hypothetical protein|nr:DUF1848 domain-containing protein [Treponema sp.]
MIISASRRTDIPAFFGEWFMERLREQFVNVPNPMNPKQVSHISLAAGDVDCFVFWTKNPKNFLPCLKQIDKSGFRYYFQFTLNPYEKNLEPALPAKAELLDTFIELSRIIGSEKVIWRYDPVIINSSYSVKFHEASFNAFCRKLETYTKKCVLSFVDNYPFLKEKFAVLGIREIEPDKIIEIAKSFSSIAKQHGIELASCAEKTGLQEYGIIPNRCIDAEFVNRLFGLDLRHKKDPAQRCECCCSLSRDIGAYNTCKYGCVYCYAERGKRQ